MKTRKLKTYTRNDYQSGEGMLTTVWGPAMWHFLHTMSFNYPNQPTVLQKKQYREENKDKIKQINIAYK